MKFGRNSRSSRMRIWRKSSSARQENRNRKANNQRPDPMFAAFLYLQFHSVKNRFGMRLRRLKKPKYLAGAIVGGLYFYFYFFRWLYLGGNGVRGIDPATSKESLAL